MNWPGKLILLTLLLVFTYSIACYSQVKKDSTWVGKVTGITRDSVHDYVLKSASIAIYKVKDSALISYQLSNNFGEFNFNEMPIGVSLKIIISYTGYKSVQRKFTILPDSKVINLKEINLERSTNELQEVVVRYVPPVRMNGDTLEFNADAFNLDKNAVGEDLLRRLPGVTVWGDGTITVNGKQVSQVLVDGKPFLSGDIKVATQNIPKTAIDKIQVYQQIKNPRNPLDSITQINIKLKNGKNYGYFGKLSAGYGTDKHYETDVNINFFNKQTQLGLVGTSNNVNKVANDANTLMRNSTYKGVGASIEYQPDFRMPGTNRPNSGGVMYQHDFIPSPDYSNSNRLAGNYFIRNNISTVVNNSQVISTISKDSAQTQLSNSIATSNSTGQVLNARYDRRKNNLTVNASSNFTAGRINSESNNQSSTYGTTGVLQSTNNTINETTSDSKNMLFQFGLSKQKNYAKMNLLPGDLDVNYSLNVGNNRSDQVNITSFTSIVDPSKSKKFDRLYNKDRNDINQHLFLSFGNLSGLLKGFLGLSISLQNSLDVNRHSEDNLVKNRDTVKNTYQTDHYLSYASNLTTINELPTLAVSRVFTRTLTNRYEKVLFWGFDAQVQFYHQQNSSDHLFQRFTRSYQKFVPNASVTYLNSHYGSYEDNYDISFSTENRYPTVDQLYPIVDSSNQYYILQGNFRLKEATDRKLSFKVKHISKKTKNTFNYNFDITAGVITNNLSDSSITDNLGRSAHYTVNVGNNRYLNISATINKAFKFGRNQLQLQFSPTLSLGRVPNYINNTINFSNNFFNSNSLSLNYTLSDWWAINLQESLSLYRSKQNGATDNEFKNSIHSTSLSSSINFTRRLGIGSNIAYNYATSTGSAPATFTIWNANATYRLLPGNNLELKMAALDLLHQNASIINIGSNNTLTRGTTNVLQQYFMLTVSYFPRQFGKRGKSKE
ncbi:outer membrane beta-barrel protein [Chitinophaga polysaccharea]|uniref:Outer membrane beta-barrel protein n=1 Tax=Chitinophaga polysaccharea TaxID=1293035 RepID=A0A561P747_9BACT|nr:outer membrane beta-barrel protein [Chitinophaga polysaccharea]TWF33936.1 outer membrane beta-barrel protein [Chitinophaga polysaccharea]